MSAAELQDVVRRLANHSFVTYFLHWNYPCQSPLVMAVRVLERGTLEAIPVQGMEDHGFEWDEVDRQYYADRTNEDGSPFRSNT